MKKLKKLRRKNIMQGGSSVLEKRTRLPCHLNDGKQRAKRRRIDPSITEEAAAALLQQLQRELHIMEEEEEAAAAEEEQRRRRRGRRRRGRPMMDDYHYDGDYDSDNENYTYDELYR